jgi:MFS superfamily sulfate permease-like transporter
LVAYIPLPVVAGYLGYLGYFCVAAALAQVTGLPISSPLSMRLVLLHPERWANVATLVLCCAVIQITVNRCDASEVYATLHLQPSDKQHLSLAPSYPLNCCQPDSIAAYLVCF